MNRSHDCVHNPIAYHRGAMPDLDQIIEQLVGGLVELVVGFVGAGVDLGADLRDLVDADIVGLQSLEEMADAGEFQLVDHRKLRGRVGRRLLLDRLLNDLLNRRVITNAVD